MVEKTELCDDCPVGKEIKLDRRAEEDLSLATKILEEQGIKMDPRIRTLHFGRHAVTLEKVGCNTGLGCRLFRLA